MVWGVLVMWILGSVLMLMGCDKEPDYPMTKPLVHVVDDNVLGWYLEWATDGAQETAVHVECGASGTLTLTEVAPRDEHLAFVGGLLSDDECDIWVTGESDGGAVQSVRITVGVGDTPGYLPLAEPTVALTSDAWVMTTLARKGAESPGLVVIYDAQGRPRWYHRPWGEGSPPQGFGVEVFVPGMSETIGPTEFVVSGFGADFPAKSMSMDGRNLWSLEAQTHHQLTQVTPDVLMGLTYDVCDGVDTNALTTFEWTGEYWQETTSWRTCEAMTPTVVSQDWDHLNAFDESNGTIVISARNQSAVFGVDTATHETVWRVGAGGDFVPTVDATFIAQHGVKLLANGHLLMVDNGNSDRPSTRALEIALTDGAATVVWSVDLGVFSPILGDIHRLEGGVTLIGLGQISGADSQIIRLGEDGGVLSLLTIGDDWAVNRVAVVPASMFGYVMEHSMAWELGI